VSLMHAAGCCCSELGNCCVYSPNNLNNHCCATPSNLTLEKCIDGLTLSQCNALAVGDLTTVFHLNDVCMNNGCNEPSIGDCTPRRYYVTYQKSYEDYVILDPNNNYAIGLSFHGPYSHQQVSVIEVTTAANVASYNSAMNAWIAQTYTSTSGNITQTITYTVEIIGTIDTGVCGRWVTGCDFSYVSPASVYFIDFNPGTCITYISAITYFASGSNFNYFYSPLNSTNTTTNCVPWENYINSICTFTPLTCPTTGGIQTCGGTYGCC